MTNCTIHLLFLYLAFLQKKRKNEGEMSSTMLQAQHEFKTVKVDICSKESEIFHFHVRLPRKKTQCLLSRKVKGKLI